MAAQRALIAQQIVPVADDPLVEKLLDNPELMALVQRLGSDQTICAYTINFRTAEGLNTRLDPLNELNNALFETTSVQTFGECKIPTAPLLVTASEFWPATYGQAFVDHYVTRCGVAPEPGASVRFLTSTQQNPVMTSTDAGDITPVLTRTSKRPRNRARPICGAGTASPPPVR